MIIQQNYNPREEEKEEQDYADFSTSIVVVRFTN